MRQADPFLTAFERFEQDPLAAGPPWLLALRQAALARFSQLGFPTLRHEDWRFTNVAPIAKLPFKPALDPPQPGVVTPTLDQLGLGRLPGHRLVFVNGHFAPALSALGPHAPGVRLGSLAAALTPNADGVQSYLAARPEEEGDAFAALNTAYFRDGAFLAVPAGTTVEEPVHLVFVAAGAEPGAAAHPRNLIIAENRSRLTVIESYVRTTDAPCLTNAVTQVVVGEHAEIEHCKFQDESPAAFHVAQLHAQVGQGAHVLSHSFALGARLSRYSIRTTLAAEGIECILNGLYLAKGEQLADHHMIVEHAKPHCNSHEYYNGILDDRARGVFHGRILVRPEAQKTDAKQTNKNLLLSDEATVDTKPQLEIYADDVKCTHGATVGQLSDDSIFYLRARGIGLETARRMLIHAFAGEIIDRLRCEPVRAELDRLIWERLEQNPNLLTAPPPTPAASA